MRIVVQVLQAEYMSQLVCDHGKQIDELLCITAFSR